MSETIRDVYLDGELGERFGTHFKLAVRSPAEACHALCMTIAGFRDFLYAAGQRGIEFGIFVDRRNIDENTYRGNEGMEDGDIRFVPVFAGAGSGGIMTVLGAVMVVVGALLIWTPFGAPLIAGGLGIMSSGIAMMLSKQPTDKRSDDDANKRVSYAFNGPVNSEAQGGVVPVAADGVPARRLITRLDVLAGRKVG